MCLIHLAMETSRRPQAGCPVRKAMTPCETTTTGAGTFGRPAGSAFAFTRGRNRPYDVGRTAEVGIPWMVAQVSGHM